MSRELDARLLLGFGLWVLAIAVSREDAAGVRPRDTSVTDARGEVPFRRVTLRRSDVEPEITHLWAILRARPVNAGGLSGIERELRSRFVRFSAGVFAFIALGLLASGIRFIR